MSSTVQHAGQRFLRVESHGVVIPHYLWCQWSGQFILASFHGMMIPGKAFRPQPAAHDELVVFHGCRVDSVRSAIRSPVNPSSTLPCTHPHCLLEQREYHFRCFDCASSSQGKGAPRPPGLVSDRTMSDPDTVFSTIDEIVLPGEYSRSAFLRSCVMLRRFWPCNQTLRR